MSSAEETPVKAEAAAAETPETQEHPQVDGAVPEGNGPALADTKFNVEVKLADLQADPNNPLFSAKSFEDLQL